jgi:hypothetical protein
MSASASFVRNSCEFGTFEEPRVNEKLHPVLPRLIRCTDRHGPPDKELTMATLVLSSLLFNTVGLVVMVLRAAAGSIRRTGA